MRGTKAILSGLACLGMLTGSIQAAEILVPADQPSLVAAVAAAQAGDTITITNSADYVGPVDIDKPLFIRAAAGQSPKILGDTTQPYAIKILETAGGTQLGSLEGGQIQVNADAFDNTTINTTVIHVGNTSGTVTLERVRVYGHYNYHNSSGATPPLISRDRNDMIRVGVSSTTPMGDVILRQVEVAGGSHGLRVVATPTTNTSTLTVENCMLDSKNFGVRANGTIDMEFKNTTIFSESSWSPVYYDTGQEGANSFTNCWLHAKGTSVVMNSASRRDHPTYFSRSAFTRDGVGTVLSMASTSYGNKWYFDHCDAVVPGDTGAVLNMATPHSQALGVGNRGVEFTNCNLINLGTGEIVAASPVQEAFLIMRSNNQVSSHATPVVANNGFATYSVAAPVATITPDYGSWQTGNLIYQNQTLLTSDENGRALGSNYNFATMTSGNINSAKRWDLYQ